jgi:RHS Repeat
MKRALVAGMAIALLHSPAIHAAETITYKYDAKGRLIEVKRTGTVNNNVTTTYTHDKADNRKNTTTTGSPNAPPP